MKISITSLIIFICYLSLIITKKINKFSSFLAVSTDVVRTLDVNDMFGDDLSSEDRYDPNLNHRKPYKDYNNVIKEDETVLLEKIKDDLTGEDVNYNYE
jgi:hypothetical protein